MSNELLLAVRQRQIEEVRALLAEGTNVNFQNEAGLSALHEATLNLDVPMITLLLQQPEICVGLTDISGNSALNHLYFEYIQGDENILLPALDLLIRSNVNLDHPDETGLTFIHWAAYNGYCAIVTRLLDANADSSGAKDEALIAAAAGSQYGDQEANQEMIALLRARLNLLGDSITSEVDDRSFQSPSV
jgi:ankyrin repeat protein